jgi:dolichyl-phosphate beta-glucosyltransferase
MATAAATEFALSIVIPAFNEAARIQRTIEAVRAYCMDLRSAWEVIVVDDGSRDSTAERVRALDARPLVIRLLTNAANRGKGYSVRRGVLEATAPRILMSDADLATPIEELEKLAAWVDRGFEVVIGSRDLPDSVLDPPQPLVRRILAWAFRAFRRRLLLPEIRDTQCGFKLFRRETARALFERATIDGWAFDCEVLAIAEKLGYRVKEVGVVWRHDRESRVRPIRHGPAALLDVLRIRRRTRAVTG